ncbi:MAG: HisA/HisF-related TIM barrel protein [Thermoplasmata archaeon]|nr:HisA/HisF-related TIM barrel protein [Thermoplasmata archaeon]
MVAVAGSDGKPRDILDITDALGKEFDALYVIDLDGRRRGEPQLDYLQEIARDHEVWLDAGVQSSDEAIDGLVTGAKHVIVSTASIPNARELRRAWKLSDEVVPEVVTHADGTVLAYDEGWGGRPIADVANEVREMGPRLLLYSPRESRPDWATVRALAIGGPVWVGGGIDPEERSAAESAGAEGIILRLTASRLAGFAAAPAPASPPP